MKKVWLIVALAALTGSAVRTFADVQNIRLSGDIRIRGYYLNNAGDANNGDAAFISQRTRVTVEADLEDHVLVVVTLKAEGLWGSDNQPTTNSGAGSSFEDGSGSAINRSWSVGLDEAYVQFNEIFYSAATLKIGRQYLHYGRGLIISSAEQEYNYDAARLVWDAYPLTIDVVGAMLANNQAFLPDSPKQTGSTPGSADLLFVNARYELSDSAIKDVEAYFGYVAHGVSGNVQSSRIPPTVFGASPMIIGLRTDITPMDSLNVWAEGAYEFGADGTFSKTISAFIANVGGKFTFKDTKWTPAVNANYIYASGGGSDGKAQFRPWFDYTEGYNGYLFAPALSNIHIFNVGASVKPAENTTLSLQGYYYMKADKDSIAGSNSNADFGGAGFTELGNGVGKRDLGWEIDSILGYDYSKDVRMQLVYGIFLPGRDYRFAGYSVAAHEVRAELNVRF